MLEFRFRGFLIVQCEDVGPVETKIVRAQFGKTGAGHILKKVFK